MQKPKYGGVCAAKNCRNKTYTCNKGFFRFPTDTNRAKIWALASNRNDLLGKLDRLYKGYRLCADHFEQKMFTNPYHNRLNPNAVPTLFPSLDVHSIHSDHAYNLPQLISVDNDPPSLSDPLYLFEETEFPRHVVIVPGQPANEKEFDTKLDVKATPGPLVLTKSTQTPSYLSTDTPTMKKYKQRIKLLASENVLLRRRIADLESTQEEIENATY